MSNSQIDPKATNPGAPYRRTTDQMVSFQLLGTIAAIIAGFFSFQYQTGKIISEVTAKITTQDGKIEAMKEDLAEIKESTKELERVINLGYPRQPLKN